MHTGRQTPGMVAQVVAAVVLATLGVIVRFVAIGAAETHLPYVTFYPPVILAALYGGLYCGLLTTLILVPFAIWWVVPPVAGSIFPHTLDTIGVILFTANSLVICAVSHGMHRARARSLAAETEVRVSHERDAAAQAVRDSEEFGRHIITSIQEGLIVLDKDLRYRVWNGFMEKASGIPAADVVGKRLEEISPWTQAQAVMESIQKAINGQTTLQADMLVVSTAGRRTWVTGRAGPMRNASGEITGVIVSFQDIDERKASEEALEDSQRRLTLALAASQAGVFELSAQTNELYWSPENHRIFGCDPALGLPTLQTWESCIHPEDLERVREGIRGAIRSPGAEFRAEYRIHHPQSGERWLLGLGRVDRDGQGNALRLTVLTIDLPSRRLAVEVRLEATRRSRCILNAGEVVAMDNWQQLVRDPEQHPFVWHMVVINEAAAQDILPLEVAAGETYQDAFWRSRDEQTNRVSNEHSAKALAAGDSSYSNLYRCTDRYGRVHWLHQTVSVEAVAPGRWRLFGVSTEITQLKQAEEALAEARRHADAARDAAEQANRAKDHFLAVLSHELRTPLTAVIPTLDMLQERVSGPDAAYMEMARRNVELEARLIDDLLDVTRIARGKIELDRHPVDLATVIAHAIEVCKPDIEARRLDFTACVEPGVCIVNGDAARLQQIFWNVLKNAVKFTPHGGCVSITCGASEDDKRAIVEVSDSGEGIESDSLGRIFNAFEQEAKATTRQFGGLGLGLAISKALVEQHAGSIRARSAGKGQGSTFIIELPLMEERSPSRQIPPADEPRPEQLAPARILLVEDHGDTARIIAHLLRGAGHTVYQASDIATALETCSQANVDVLISDLGLPDGSGHELLRLARERGTNCPAIALSGFGMAVDVEQSRAAGYAEHLTKPVTFAALQAAIARTLAANSPGSPASAAGKC